MLCGELRGKEIPKTEGYMYTYDWFIFLYNIETNNIRKQLYSNKKLLKTWEYPIYDRGLDRYFEH